MIIPLMTYCDVIHLDLSESSLTKFHQLESRADNIIRNGLSKTYVDLNLPNIRSIHIYNASMAVFKSLNKTSCVLFNNYFILMNHARNTRNNGNCIIVPKVKLEIARKGFFIQGALIFNRLPAHIRQLKSVVLFKAALKQFLEHDL